MPPKKKDKRKPSIQRPPTLINGLSKEEISKEQLDEHIINLQRELDTQRKENNVFQLKKEKIQTFQKISDRQLEENEAKLKHLETVVEDGEGHHKSEIKMFKQKMKYLLYEHQNTISELKAGGLVSINACQKEHDEQEAELCKKIQATMVDIENLDITVDVMELELKHEKDMTTTRDNWERLITNTKAKALEKMQLEQRKLAHVEMNATNEQKLQCDNFINEFKEDQKDICDIKKDLASMIVDLIMAGDLEKKIAALQNTKRKTKEEKCSVQQKSCDLKKLISKLGEKIANSHKRAESISKNKLKMPKGKALENLKADHEVMEQKFSKLQLERDEMSKSVPEKIQSVHDKGYLVNRLLEVQLQILEDHLEEVQAQLHSVLSAPNMDCTALAEVACKVKEDVEFKNATIKELEHRKKPISKACKDLQLTAETRDLFS